MDDRKNGGAISIVRNFATLILWGLASLLVPVCSMADERPLLLIDHSGSMAGFVSDGVMDRAVTRLKTGLNDNPRVLWVVSNAGGTTLKEGNAPPEYGSETRLHEAVQRAILLFPSAPSLWLLTDNLPSHHRQDEDLGNLYSWLRSSDGPSTISLFVLKMPFDGPLYQANGHTKLTDRYRGQRALVLYATYLRPPESPAESHMEHLQRVRRAFEAWPEVSSLQLRCKPLSFDSVEMELIPEDGFTMAADGALEGRGKEGEPFHGRFAVRLRSKLDHVEFRDAIPNFSTSGFFHTSDFDTFKLGSKVEESRIPSIGQDSWAGFDVTLKLEPARLERTWASALKAFGKGPEPGVLKGSMLIEVEVERRSVVIVNEDVEEFSTGRDVFADDSPHVQSRIYRLQELFQEKFIESHLKLHPARIPEPEGALPGTIPVRIYVTYSPANAAVLVVYLLGPFVALIIVGLILAAIFNARYQIEGGGVSNQPFKVSPSAVVKGDAGVLGTLYRVPPFLLFKASSGWVVAKSLDTEPKGKRVWKSLPQIGGDLVLIRRAGGERVFLKVQSVKGRPGVPRANAGRPQSLRSPFD